MVAREIARKDGSESHYLVTVKFMKRLTLWLLLVVVGVSNSFSADAAAPIESPHAQVILLVMQTRSEEIRKIDQSDHWWHDTKDRAWSAKRPFEPGIVDSTHYFKVKYSINGHVVATWTVNTRTGQVAGPGESIRID